MLVELVHSSLHCVLNSSAFHWLLVFRALSPPSSTTVASVLFRLPLLLVTAAQRFFVVLVLSPANVFFFFYSEWISHVHNVFAWAYFQILQTYERVGLELPTDVTVFVCVHCITVVAVWPVWLISTAIHPLFTGIDPASLWPWWKKKKTGKEKKNMSLHLLIFSIFRCFLTLLLPSGARETPNYLQVKITTNLSAFLSLALFALW